MASDAVEVVLGAFMNLKAVADYLLKRQEQVVIFCSGWKNKVNLEDTLFAGALSTMLLESGGYATFCDSAHLSMDIWNVARDNPIKYIEKASHRHRLAHLIDDELLNYTFKPGKSNVIPVYDKGNIIRKIPD